MKNIIVVILSILILDSCKKNEVELVWSEEKAVEILADLRVIDAQLKKHLASTRDSVQLHFKEILLSAHNITDEDLTKHIELIQSSPKLAAELEKKVNDLLKKRLEDIRGKK